MLHGLDQIGHGGSDRVLAPRGVERDADYVREARPQHVGDAQNRGVVGLEHPDCGGVRRGQARVQVKQVVLCRSKIIALARAHEGDDRDAGGGGGVEFEQATRAEEHLLGLEEHDHVRVEDMADKFPEVAKVVGICGQMHAFISVEGGGWVPAEVRAKGARRTCLETRWR